MRTHSMQKYLEAKHRALSYATSQCVLNAEINVIMAAIGGMTARLRKFY